MLVADVDGSDVVYLDKYLLFFPLYELTEVLIRVVFVLFNWLILFLGSLPNSQSDSGGTFFANGYIFGWQSVLHLFPPKLVNFWSHYS